MIKNCITMKLNKKLKDNTEIFLECPLEMKSRTLNVCEPKTEGVKYQACEMMRGIFSIFDRDGDGMIR